jgi:hypothetical protein
MLCLLTLLYGVLGYVASIATIAYPIVFLGFFIVPEHYRKAIYIPLRWSCDNVDMAEAFGEPYRDWRRAASMIFPLRRPR